MALERCGTRGTANYKQGTLKQRSATMQLLDLLRRSLEPNIVFGLMHKTTIPHVPV